MVPERECQLYILSLLINTASLPSGKVTPVYSPRISSHKCCQTWPTPEQFSTALKRVPLLILSALFSLRASQGVPVLENPPAKAGGKREAGSIPGPGRSPGGRNGSLLQESCLGRGAWRATVHEAAKRQTRPSTPTHTHVLTPTRFHCRPSSCISSPYSLPVISSEIFDP